MAVTIDFVKSKISGVLSCLSRHEWRLIKDLHRDVNEAEEEEWLLDDVFIRPFLSVSELFLIEEVLHVPKQCNAKDHIEQTHY